MKFLCRMEKYLLHSAFIVVLVLVLVTKCCSIPLRYPRDVQDLIQLNDVEPIQDYGYSDADLQGDTSHLSPPDESGSHDFHQYLDDHSFDGNTTENIDDAGLAQKPRDDGLIHDLDIIGSGGSDAPTGQVLDHAVNGAGNVEENARASHADTGLRENDQLNLQGLGHLSSSRHTAIRPTSESHDDMELPVTTRRTNSRNGQHLSAEGPIQHANVSSHEEHETNHGFLMVDNIQNIDNERTQLSTNHLTSKLTTPHQTLTTTTSEQLTVKLLNISNQEQIERTGQGHIPVNGVIIRQSSGAHSDLDSGSVDNNDHLNESTEMPLSHHGQVPVFPREPHVHNPEHEEPEVHQPGVDVPIDKGEHAYTNNEEEHVDYGSPRRHGNFPEVEPTVTTPILRILPTPAQQEPEERNTSAENVGPQSSVNHQGDGNEHTESYNESAGHIGEPSGSHVHGNSGLGNQTEERLVTAVEGHIEFITEDPEIYGDTEIKSNKHVTKDANEKASSAPSSLSPSFYVFESESFTKVLDIEMTPSQSQLRFTLPTETQLLNSMITAPSGKSEIEKSHLDLQSSALSRTTEFIEVTSSESISSYFQSGSDSSVSLASTMSSLPPVEQLTHSNSLDISTPNFQDTPLASLSELASTAQQLDFSSTNSALFTMSSNEAFTKGYPGGSSAGTVVAVHPSVSTDLSVETDQAIFSSHAMTSTVPAMPVKDNSSSPASSQFDLNTSYSLQVTPSPHLQHTAGPGFQGERRLKVRGSEVHGMSLHSDNASASTTATQSIQAPASVSVMPSINTTTKKKGEHNSTTSTTTALTIRKKPDSGKDNDKSENHSSTTTSSVGTSTHSSSARTFPHFFTMPTSVHVTLLKKPELTTTPSVYIEIQLRMDWNQFCVSKSHFISEIQGIVLKEKGYIVDEERFKMNAEDCGSANSLIDGSITIQMYIVDNNGKLDIPLTTDASYVISKGFQKSNYLKSKIESARTVFNMQPETLPDSRAERKEAPPAVTMVIVIASVGGLCCVALIILQVLIHRRIKAKRKQRVLLGHRASLQSMDHVALGVIPKSRPSSGYWNPALDNTIELPEPEEHSHILNFSGLANFCMDTKGIYAEFQTIPFDDVELSSVPVGEEDKNRFANVLPYKHSRVSLKATSENKQGYINANYINGYMEEKKVYIATQSPLLNTVEDFWRMVWEQQSRTILMLNPVTQHGKPKQSTCYWPDNLETDCRREFGDYSVTLKKRDVQHKYIDCTLEIMDIERNLKREIHHFWFTSWSDTGPPEPLTLVKFVLDTRPCFENSGCPVILHCGPGTGRTGVYIAVDKCMRMFEDRRRVDIQSCVHTMRSERAGAVQTKEQYNLIYQALNEYAVILSSPSISTRSSVITLHAML